MRDSPERQAAILGLFVAIGLAILVGAFAVIGGLGDRLTRTVRVAAVFDQVSGLSPGDAVWFSGVKVGTVQEVEIAGPQRVEVEMAISPDASRYVTADALARIGTDGLIGNPIVILYGGTEGTRAIEPGDVLGVGETVSPEQVLATFQENNQNLLVVTENLEQLTTRLAEGEGTVGRLLADESLYEELDATVATLRETASSARTVGRDLAAFTDQLDDPGSLPHDLVTDTTTYPALTDAVERLGDVVAGIEQGVADPDTPVGTLLGDREAGADLKATLENLETATELLEEDLEALQDSFLLRGPFRRKARAEEEAAEEAPPPEPEPPARDPGPSS